MIDNNREHSGKRGREDHMPKHVLALFVVLTSFIAPALSADIFPEENKKVLLSWPATSEDEDGLQCYSDGTCSGTSALKVESPDVVTVYYPDRILVKVPREHEESSYNKYDLFVVPFSVSVEPEMRARIRRLNLYAQILGPYDENPASSDFSIIQSVFPSDKKETQSVATVSFAIRSEAGIPILKQVAEAKLGREITVTTATIESGHHESESYWKYNENDLRGNFRMIVLVALKPTLGSYGIRITFDVFGKTDRPKLSHEFVADLEFPE